MFPCSGRPFTTQSQAELRGQDLLRPFLHMHADVCFCSILGSQDYVRALPSLSFSSFLSASSWHPQLVYCFQPHDVKPLYLVGFGQWTVFRAVHTEWVLRLDKGKPENRASWGAIRWGHATLFSEGRDSRDLQPSRFWGCCAPCMLGLLGITAVLAQSIDLQGCLEQGRRKQDKQVKMPKSLLSSRPGHFPK